MKAKTKKNFQMIVLIAVIYLLSHFSLPVYDAETGRHDGLVDTVSHGFMMSAYAEDGEEEEEDEDEEEIDVDCNCDEDGELDCADEEAEEEAEEYECECDEDGEVICEAGGSVILACTCSEEGELDCKDEEAEQAAEEYECECDEDGAVICEDESVVAIICSCDEEGELNCENEEDEETADEYGCECDEDGELYCEGGDSGPGQELFEAYCSRCHGIEGDGKGEASNFTYPRPRDFTSGMFKFRSTPSGEPPTDDDLKRTILGGLAGTSMFGWKSKLSETDVEAIIEYIKTEFAYEAFEFEGEPFEIGEPPAVTPEIIQSGKDIFQKAKCWECHGKYARGNGEKGWQPNFKDDWGYKIWPTNLNHPWEMRNGSSVKDIYRSITTALDGTPMPSFSDAYSDEQRWGIAHYIKSLHIKRKLGSKVVLSKVEEIPFSTDDKKWDSVNHLDLKMEGKKVFGMTLLSALTNVRVRGVYSDAEIAIMLEWMDKKPDKGEDDFPPDSIRLQFPVTRGFLNIWYWNALENSVAEYNTSRKGMRLNKQKQTDVEIVSAYSDGIYRVVFKRSWVTADRNDVDFGSRDQIPFSVIAYDGKNGEEGERGARSSVKYMVFKQFPSERSKSVKAGVKNKKGK